MAERTMEELLRAPTEGITSTLRFRDVSNDVIKLMMFPYSLEGAAKVWYEKELPNSILTWEDLVTKFVNQFFPPSKTTHLKNEISHFTQKFEETFSEAWERFKEMLRAYPHHGFTELTQVDTIYNDLNENDQDSLNAAAGRNLLRESKTDERIDKLADQLSTLVEIVSKKVVTPALVKAVEEICVTCSGPHAWYNCPNTDNNQASVCAATGSYNQVNPPNRVSNQMAPPGFAPMQNNGQNRFNQNQGQGNNFNRGVVMSADSAVTYTSVHSEARSWSIPSEDPYEEAARQLLEQAPRSPEYVPDPMELEDHVPVYIPEPEHPEDLVPAEDEAPTPPLPPFFLSPRIRPPHTRAAMRQMRAAQYHPPINLHYSHQDPTICYQYSTLQHPLAATEYPEADTPPRKRLLLTTPRPSCEVGESSAAAAARQPGPTMAHRVDHSLVDTMETRFRDTERRMMTALEMVNMRVSYPGRIPPKREYRSFQFTLRHLTMPSKDRVQTERAEIDVLRRKDFL
ncbi:reverse transcriptase domain-containing protein [Tanacetum coccineum]